jgi:hypothetical protein
MAVQFNFVYLLPARRGAGWSIALIGRARSVGGGSAYANMTPVHQVAEGIRSVLGGAVKSFSIEYPCPFANWTR